MIEAALNPDDLDKSMNSMEPKIVYRGVCMIESWPQRIQDAQAVKTCFVHGKQVPRVRYGEEGDDWGADRKPCHDCAAVKGEFHVEGCDVERCAGCGGQRFNCDCEGTEGDA